MSLIGIGFGLFSLLIIGFGFLWVIKGEYYLGYLWWPYPLLLGVVLVLGSLWLASPLWSALLGIAGASFIWGSTELKEQAVRADLGWFRRNPQPKPAPPLLNLIRKIEPPHL